MPKKHQSIWDILDKPTVYTGEVRKLVRPVINIKAVIVSIILHLLVAGLISAVVSAGVYLALNYFFASPFTWSRVVVVTMLVCYAVLFLFKLKRMMIFAVLIYQAKAPDEIRLRCTFTPSCSEYMIASLEKYGAVAGLTKGLKRLSRCRNSNGYGYEDYP